MTQTTPPFHTVCLECFAIHGISQGCAFAVCSAAENPDRVGCLVVRSGCLRGRLKRGDPEQRALQATMEETIQHGWGLPNPVFR